MAEQRLHIVSFDVPFPPDYGGVIDVYYKIRALSESGLKIILHCFHYGRPPAKELEALCEKVHYYPRKSGLDQWCSGLPYITATRRSDDLLINLRSVDAPVLFEGLHCCAYLDHPSLQSRVKLVRMHNIEHDYYSSLARAESSLLKRIYFRAESRRLKKFEGKLSYASHVLAISDKDGKELSGRYGNVSVAHAFHPDDRVRYFGTKEPFALYHGNLAVGENDEAALFLVKEVFDGEGPPLYIAGRNPSQALRKAAEANSRVRLLGDADLQSIMELIRKAVVNVLPTFQSTGIKLKLLAALYNGGHCLVNPAMVEGTGLGSLCTVAKDAAEMKQALPALMNRSFTQEDAAAREKVLAAKWSNRDNARRIMELLQPNQ